MKFCTNWPLRCVGVKKEHGYKTVGDTLGVTKAWESASSDLCVHDCWQKILRLNSMMLRESTSHVRLQAGDHRLVESAHNGLVHHCRFPAQNAVQGLQQSVPVTSQRRSSHQSQPSRDRRPANRRDQGEHQWETLLILSCRFQA